MRHFVVTQEKKCAHQNLLLFYFKRGAALRNILGLDHFGRLPNGLLVNLEKFEDIWRVPKFESLIFGNEIVVN